MARKRMEREREKGEDDLQTQLTNGSDGRERQATSNANVTSYPYHHPQSALQPDFPVENPYGDAVHQLSISTNLPIRNARPSHLYSPYPSISHYQYSEQQYSPDASTSQHRNPESQYSPYSSTSHQPYHRESQYLSNLSASRHQDRHESQYSPSANIPEAAAPPDRVTTGLGASTSQNVMAAPPEDRPHCTYPQCQDEKGHPTKFYSRKADVHRHVRCQHQEKRYDCPFEICDRKGYNGFTRKDHLYDHRRQYHAETIPKKNQRKGDAPTAKATFQQERASRYTEQSCSHNRRQDPRADQGMSQSPIRPVDSFGSLTQRIHTAHTSEAQLPPAPQLQSHRAQPQGAPVSVTASNPQPPRATGTTVRTSPNAINNAEDSRAAVNRHTRSQDTRHRNNTWQIDPRLTYSGSEYIGPYDVNSTPDPPPLRQQQQHQYHHAQPSSQDPTTSRSKDPPHRGPRQR